MAKKADNGNGAAKEEKAVEKKEPILQDLPDQKRAELFMEEMKKLSDRFGMNIVPEVTINPAFEALIPTAGSQITVGLGVRKRQKGK